MQYLPKLEIIKCLLWHQIITLAFTSLNLCPDTMSAGGVNALPKANFTVIKTTSDSALLTSRLVSASELLKQENYSMCLLQGYHSLWTKNKLNIKSFKLDSINILHHNGNTCLFKSTITWLWVTNFVAWLQILQVLTGTGSCYAWARLLSCYVCACLAQFCFL